MEYRVIDFTHSSQVEIGTFDSAYDAVDCIVAMHDQGEDRARHLYVVDSDGVRIFGPTDLYQMGFEPAA